MITSTSSQGHRSATSLALGRSLLSTRSLAASAVSPVFICRWRTLCYYRSDPRGFEEAVGGDRGAKTGGSRVQTPQRARHLRIKGKWERLVGHSEFVSKVMARAFCPFNAADRSA